MADINVITLTNDNFNEYIDGELPLLVDFWASWCGPCRMLGPVIDEIASSYKDKLNVGKVNVDEQPELASQFKIMTIPTVYLIKNKKVLGRLNGAVSLEQMEDFIDGLI